MSVKHIIDLDATPYIPDPWKVEDGWKIESHKKGGQWEYDPAKVKLYLSAQQQSGKEIEGKELRKELEGQPVFNANLLDYYLAHPELIPDSWKDKVIFFWGTIYSDSSGRLYVRSLFCNGGSWYRYYGCLGGKFYFDSAVAVAGK